MRDPFFFCGSPWQQVLDFVALIGGDALQAADRNGFAVHTLAAACRLARAIAGAPENAGKDVGFAVEQVGVGVSALRDQPDVFGHIRVGRARPLTIHDFVEVVRVANISRFHDDAILYPFEQLW